MKTFYDFAPMIGAALLLLLVMLFNPAPIITRARLLILSQIGTIVTGGLTAESFAPILKELYTKQRIVDNVLGDNRLLKWLNTDENYSGKKMPIPIRYGNPQGASHTFATGKANITTSKYTDFYLTVNQDFGFVRIDHKTLMEARNDMGAFLRAKEPEIDGMLANLGRRTSIELYGNGSGARGQISAPGASTTVTLVNHRDITNFEEGQILKLATDNPTFGTTGAGVEAGRMQVVTINYDNGTFTVDQNVTTAIPTAADLDWLYVEGDYQGALVGLAGWIPATAPTAGDNFFDVDRSINTRLYGMRYDAATAGDSAVEGLVRLLSKIASISKNTGVGLPDACFCDPSYWVAVELELGAKVQYVNPGEEGSFNIGASGIRINYEGGSVPLFSDIDCPANRVYALNKKSFKRWSMGPAPSLFDADGVAWLRAADANALDVQAYGYQQLACDAPIANGVALVTPQTSLFS